jgi:C-terminal processing protease CtpA/Prc
VIAAVLRTHLGAYVIGSQTRGEAAQFEEIALEKGRVLKVAVGEVTLPDATPVFPGGLRPDLVVEVPQEKTDAVLFAAQQETEIGQFVTETERARMNEAALVAGTNPETDAAIEAQRKKAAGESGKPQLRDVALQRAVDYITAVRITESGARK